MIMWFTGQAAFQSLKSRGTYYGSLLLHSMKTGGQFQNKLLVYKDGGVSKDTEASKIKVDIRKI